MKGKEKTVELTASEKFSLKIEAFFKKYFKLFIALIAAIIILIVAIGLITNSQNKKTDELYKSVAALDKAYSELITMDNTTDEYKEAANSFLSEADNISSKDKSYPGLKATYLKALYSFNEKDYSKAAELFEEVANSQNGSYLASLSLVNAAACYENLNQVDNALSLYNKVWNDYGKNAFESSKALFNIARIYEEKGDSELAKATYQQLIDEFGSSSEYSKLASARVAAL